MLFDVQWSPIDIAMWWSLKNSFCKKVKLHVHTLLTSHHTSKLDHFWARYLRKMVKKPTMSPHAMYFWPKRAKTAKTRFFPEFSLVFFLKSKPKMQFKYAKLRRSRISKTSDFWPKMAIFLPKQDFSTKIRKCNFRHIGKPQLSEQSYERVSRSPPNVRTNERTWFNRSQPLRGGPKNKKTSTPNYASPLSDLLKAIFQVV